ncbi:ENDOU [Branchiostoma lanceolatum]|uniref:Uridylate-specific endoribonuclease n=1 Tax=Branchiostoma lanceolatum TaxID=7740 RepID=A0A8K0A0W3_BRALA|nr:ENDOU [Branchiostoma lanceolatum]
MMSVTTASSRLTSLGIKKKKTRGGFFLGTSPEFELAIYTVCFLAGYRDETTVTLGDRNAIIHTNVYRVTALLPLLSNYETETSIPEQITPGKENKNRAFLNRCLERKVMKVAHDYLFSKGLVPQSKKAFKELLYHLWFKLHPRPSGDETERSAFEHVFVGETCQGKILGFHNWVQLYLEERQGNVRYKGFWPTTSDDRIITINFTWKNGSSKTRGSFFLGTSPEFELAIYTVCFLAGDKDEMTVTLGNKPAIIVAYYAGGNIGACYPKLQTFHNTVIETGCDLHVETTNVSSNIAFDHCALYQGKGPSILNFMMGSLSEVCKTLWDLDHNRLKSGKDYKINLKGTKLFSSVDTKKFDDIPTYKALIPLLNHYEPVTTVPEKETQAKSDMSRAFLNRCLETAVMKKARSFLLSKGPAPGRKGDPEKAFKKLLYKLWFQRHSRPNEDGTKMSAFEHVFVGEISNGLVRGFHNWVQLYLEERQKNLRYKGFEACDKRIITIDFTWKNGSSKTNGSFFLGTSPEFELAIYTVCFLVGDRRKDETAVILGNKPAIIVTHRADGQIGTCYPKLQNPRCLKAVRTTFESNLNLRRIRQTSGEDPSGVDLVAIASFFEELHVAMF